MEKGVRNGKALEEGERGKREVKLNMRTGEEIIA